MADPTAKVRRAIGEKLPGALGESLEKDYKKDDEQLAADEANNLVEQKSPVALPAEAAAFTNPQIPGQTAPQTETKFVNQGEAASPDRSVAAAAPNATPASVSSGPGIPDTSKDGSAAIDAYGKESQEINGRLEQINKDRAASIQKMIEDDEKEVEKIEPKTFFEGKNTWQKLLGGIGMFLGSITPEGAKNVAGIVEKEINRDIEIQKQNLALKNKKKDANYQKMIQKYGSEEAALLAKKKGAFDLMDLQLKKLELNARNAEARARISMGREELGMKKEQLKLEQVKLGMKAQQDATKYSIPGFEGAPLDPATKREFVNMQASADTIKSSLGELSSLAKGTGEGIPFTQKNDRAVQLVGDIQLQLKEIKKLGVLSGDDAKRLDYYISNPSIFKSDARMQNEIAGVEKLVNTAMQKQQRLLGISPKGVAGAREIK